MTIFFNPYKQFVGCFVPNWLMEMGNISAGAKLVYAKLCQMAGEKGSAYPKQDTLGRAVCLGERQVRRCIDELVTAGLLYVKRHGQGNPSEYFFLWIEALMAPSVRGPDRTDMTGQERTDVSGPYIRKEKNQGKERAAPLAATDKPARKPSRLSTLSSATRNAKRSRAPDPHDDPIGELDNQVGISPEDASLIGFLSEEEREDYGGL